MKERILSLFFLVPLMATQGIHFEDGVSWQHVQQKAKAEDKYIFVDCYATWCGPCKQMDKKVCANEGGRKILDFTANEGSYMDVGFSPEGKFLLFEPGWGCRGFFQGEHKFFVDCYAKWFGPCRVMDKKVYENEKNAANLNGDFVFGKVSVGHKGNKNKPNWKLFKRREIQGAYIKGFTAGLELGSKQDAFCFKVARTADLVDLIVC